MGVVESILIGFFAAKIKVGMIFFVHTTEIY